MKDKEKYIKKYIIGDRDSMVYLKKDIDAIISKHLGFSAELNLPYYVNIKMEGTEPIEIELIAFHKFEKTK